MSRKLARIFAVAAAALFAAGETAPRAQTAPTTLCAVVQLQISQQAALEREAFSAKLVVSNNIVNQPLTNLQVQIFFKDPNGNPADSLFFVKITTLTGTNAIDGSGVVQSSSTAEIDWIIIPSTRAGGALPAGIKYGVTATINAQSNGAPQAVTTFPAPITVNPQPLVKLEYVLPYEVFGDEPLTTQIEPIEPFPLGVRATNVGFGPATNFQITSAQPVITDNKLGLAVDFKLLGTVVSGKSVPNSLLVPFGTVAPGAVGQAEWTMASTLSGRFVNFTSTFTHAADLGGQLTSLLQSVTTYTLIKDVLVDLPGRDAIPDFLVNETSDRGGMQALLDSGVQPPAQFILESDQPAPIPVVEIPGAVSGSLGGGSASVVYSFASAVSSNVWVHSSVPFTVTGSTSVASAQRADGKVMNPHNVWISKHFVKATLKDIYWLNVLDLTSSATSYTIQFNPSGLDLPPAAIGNLAAATGLGSGALALSWSAPGEDGSVGNLFGARYLFETAIDSGVVFAPQNAQLNIATATPAGAAQQYVLSNLIGNATTYAAVWTQDAGGNLSGISNGATAYTLPNPPTSLVFSTVAFNAIPVSWQIGNNSLPINYQVAAATAPGGTIVSSSPFQDSFNRTATLTGLLAQTTYFILGKAVNPTTGVASPFAVLGSTVTPKPRDALPPRTTVAISSPQYSAGGNLYVTRRSSFTFSSIDDALVAFDALGVGTSVQYVLVDGVGRSTFTNANPAVGQVFTSTLTLANDADGVHYVSFYGQDVVGNRESVHVATVAVDNTPPVSTMTIGSPSFTALDGSVYIATTTAVTLSALDPPVVAGGTRTVPGSGLARIDVAVDTAAFSIYGGTLTFAEGRHVVVFRSVDNLGNVESTHTVTLSADATPPVSSISIGAPQFALSSTTLLVSAQTPIVLASTDPVVNSVASGVRQVSYQVNGGAFAVYAATITLSPPDQLYTIGFFGQDDVLNTEVLKSTTVLLDSTPPQAAILAPAGPGIESVVNGVFPVIGSVSDLHLASWRLEWAPGGYAASGFTLISSGTVAVSSGPLGIWNASALSGWQTLKLTAVDLVLNTTVVAQNVFVGDPQVQVVVGGRKTLNKPFDAAEGSDGKIYVADANDNRLAVFTSTGGLLASFGSLGGGDDHRSSGLSLNKPKSVAVDASGNIFVADTNDNRVLKLSNAGQILLTIPAQSRGGGDDHGHQQGQHSDDPGTASGAPGQLNHPHGIALDSSGNLYVSDTDNHRVQKFAPDGTFMLAVNLSSAPVWKGDDDEREDDSDLGRPVGIALDGAGAIYVADAAGNRVLKFDPAGALLQTFGAGKLNGPLGVAVSASADVLVVSDSGDNRILKLDRFGNVNQTYAPTGAARPGDNGDDSSTLASTAALNVPAELFLDAAGGLFAADRNNNRVLKFVSPAAPPMPVAPAAPAAVVASTSSDVLPPRTTVSVSSPQWNAGGMLYVTRQTSFTLLSVDDGQALNDALGLGTSVQFLLVDGVARSTFTTAGPAVGKIFTSTFTLSDADGLHVLSFYGQDLAGNRESVRVATVAVDNAPPVSTMTIGSPSFTASGSIYIATTTPVALSAADPALALSTSVSIPGSGLARIDVAVDTGAFAAYISTLTFAAGRHTLVFRAVDNLGNQESAHTIVFMVGAASSTTVACSTATATARVRKDLGGKVERLDRAAVIISSGALAADLDISVSTPIRRSDLEETVKTRKRAEASLVAISTGVEYLPEGTTFAAPVTLILPYDAGALASLGIQETDLRAFYWNRGTERWDAMPGTVDVSSHVVLAQTLHFSLYQVMGPGQGGGVVAADLAAAAGPFQFNNVYAYPNPARPGQAPTIHVEAGSADHVEVHIYDLSGKLIESVSSDGTQAVFEYRWDVSGIGSGVYIYVVTATKSGQGKIRRTNRLAIIK